MKFTLLVFVVAAFNFLQLTQTQVYQQNAPVYFMADLRNGDNTAHNSETPVVFTNVQLNIGQTYDSDSGRFTAPYDGQYEFTMNVMPNNADGFAWMHTSTKYDVVTYLHVTSPWISGSKTAIVDLKKGDRVWVTASAGLALWPGTETTFTGKSLPGNIFAS